jgi:hypothetical protein
MINLNEHQAIVIQGPMQYDPMRIANFYSQFDNIVWSTWDDEDSSIIEQVRSTGITVLLNKKPNLSGSRNVNYQFLSTFGGIQHFRINRPKITEIIKVRSDLLVFGIERLLNRVSGSDISFMYVYNKHKEPHRPVYYLDYWHEGMDFPADFIVHGNIDVMYNIFNFQMEFVADIPPESIILRNYLKYRNFENNFDIEYLKSIGITFFANWTETDYYYSLSLKHGWDWFKRAYVLH